MGKPIHPVQARPAPKPDLYKERSALRDELTRVEYQFLRHPTMELVEEMEAVRERMTALERRIVKTAVFAQMLDMLDKGEEPVVIGDLPPEEADEYL